jgi:hypothetical protein
MKCQTKLIGFGTPTEYLLQAHAVTLAGDEKDAVVERRVNWTRV